MTATVSEAPAKAEDKKENGIMEALLISTPQPPEEGALVDGEVLSIEKNKVFVDLPPFGTGIIYGREFMNARDILRKVRIGDAISAKVVDAENEDGYIELSLKEARQALLWSEAEQAINNKQIFELVVKEANKGGLMLEWQGIQGFLPASQLTSDHYPRVEDGDKDKILDELRKLVGEKISVTFITADPIEGKLIFSEKGPEAKEKEQIVDKYTVGDIVEGEVTGAVDFGVFLKIQEGLEGLVHISELDWGLVENPKTLFEVGTKMPAKVIEVKDGKISLSIKQLKKSPWQDAKDTYAKDQTVEATIIKYNKHGALASIEEGVAGLVHISEFPNEEKLRATLELGKSYPFRITLFDPNEQRMTLAYAGEKDWDTPTQKRHGESQ